MVAVAAVPVKPVAKVRARPVHRAMVLLHHAAMAPKARRALKARAMAAVKADERGVVKAVVAKNNVAIPVLTTVVMAKAVPHRVVHVLRAVVLLGVVKVVAKAVKTVVVRMAMSCHATSTP